MFKKTFALLFCLIFGFVWGLSSGHYKVFPFSILKETKSYIAEFFPKPPKNRIYRPAERFFTSNAERLEITCPNDDPITFVALGQSNAANSLSSFGERDPEATAYQFYDGKCYLMEDPTIGSTGDRGSLWTEFAQSLSQASGWSVVFVTAAVEASSVNDWLEPESGYFDRAARQISQAIDSDLTPKFVLWHQGETDALSNTDPLDYTLRLKTLIEQVDQLFEPGLEPTWIIFQTSICRGLPNGSRQLVEAQRNVTKQHMRAILGPNTDQLGSLYRYDGCHFNANGKARIIEELRTQILDLENF